MPSTVDDKKKDIIYNFLRTLSSDDIGKIRLIYFSLTWCDVNTFIRHYINNRQIISGYRRFLSGKRAPRIAIEVFVAFVLDMMIVTPNGVKSKSSDKLDYIYGVVVDEIDYYLDNPEVYDKDGPESIPVTSKKKWMANDDVLDRANELRRTNKEEVLEDVDVNITNFKFNMNLPTDNIKVIIFVDGDNLSPEDISILFVNQIPVHMVVVVGPQWENMKRKALNYSHVTYIRTNNFEKDSADLVITMLLSTYLTVNPVHFYIVSNDKFAQTVVDNIMNIRSGSNRSEKQIDYHGKVITSKQSLTIDLLYTFDFDYHPEYTELRNSILKLRRDYSSYYFDNYLIAASLEYLPSHITHEKVAKTIPCNQNIGFIDDLKRFKSLHELIKLRKVIRDSQLPDLVEKFDYQISQSLMNMMFIKDFHELINLECVQRFLGIKVYKKYIFKGHNYDFFDELVIRNTIRRKIESGELTINSLIDKYENVTGFHIHYQSFRLWLDGGINNYYPGVDLAYEVLE